MFAQQQEELLDTVDGIALSLIEAMRRADIDSPERLEQYAGLEAVHQELRNRIGALAPVAALRLSDLGGRVLSSSADAPARPVDDADREFIRDGSVAGVVQPFVGAPHLDPESRRWTVDIGRRLEAADGHVIGLAVSSLRIDRTTKVHAGFPIAGDISLALRRAKVPDASYQQSITSSNGTPIDSDVGADQITVHQSMIHRPLIVTISVPMAPALRNWKAQVYILSLATTLLELLIAGIVLLAVRDLRTRERLKAAEAALYRAEIHLAVGHDRERNEAALRVQEQRFDLAMKNMIQGLVVADRSENVLAVNGRFCEIWGLPADIVTPGMNCCELESLALSGGNIRPDDITEIRRRREEAADRNSSSTFVWELADGRALRVNHQPTEEGWLTTYEDISDQRRAEAKIAHLAGHDGLTDLPNRVLFLESLERALALARRGHMMALHYLDLDKFAVVNDTFGHLIGDSLLQAVARRLQSGVRQSDMVARLGGDEFAIIQIPMNAHADATILANRLNELIKAPFEIEGHQLVIGTCIGIAFAPDDGEAADQITKCADMALYQAKSDGSGGAHLYDAEMDAALRTRNALEADLRLALGRGQFELFFQPQIDVQTRRIAGCEALLRWRHPTKGLVPPDQFIPLAEDTGMIMQIGEWVLRQACATAVADWPGDVRVAVNLSAVQFRGNDMVDVVRSALRDSGLDAGRLELEITETVMLQDTACALSTLHQLRELGVEVAMDDFGTGYSSLSYLRRFPFNRIKIDQSFIRDLGNHKDCIAIVRAVMTLGRDLGMSITAEGVETRQQLLTLEDAGCTEVQGYLFSRPVAAAEVAALLQHSSSIIAHGWPPGEWTAMPAPPGPVPTCASGLFQAGMRV
jgi:diguanylate cyclase (GGDEF)-like protein